MIMKRLILRTIPLLAALAGCHQQVAQERRVLDAANVTRAMNDYLARRGDLCLAKSDWPVVVTEAESHAGSRNALQMPVLRRLGLVEAADVLVDEPDADGTGDAGGKAHKVHALRYTLTAEGRKYYLARPPHRQPGGNRYAEVDHDFCAARLSLDRVVGWEPAAGPDGKGKEAVVTYTYRIAAAPWTSDSAVRAVFPMVDRVIRGAGAMQLTEGIVLGPAGWEAKDL
jgi:hypothetical protein